MSRNDDPITEIPAQSPRRCQPEKVRPALQKVFDDLAHIVEHPLPRPRAQVGAFGFMTIKPIR